MKHFLSRLGICLALTLAGVTANVACGPSRCAYAAEVAYPTYSGSRSGSSGSSSSGSRSSGYSSSGSGGHAPSFSGSRASKAPTFSGSRSSGGSVASSSASRAQTFNGSHPEGSSTLGHSYNYAGHVYVVHSRTYYTHLSIHNPYDPYDPTNYYNSASPWFHYAVYAPC